MAPCRPSRHYAFLKSVPCTPFARLYLDFTSVLIDASSQHDRLRCNLQHRADVEPAWRRQAASSN